MLQDELLYLLPIEPILSGRRICRCVRVAKRFLFHRHRDTVSSRFSHRFHLHVKACLLCTSHVKSDVAVRAMALDARSRIPLLANVATELPASLRYILQSINWLQKHSVSKRYFRNPKRTHL